MAVSGPRVLELAISEKITDEELGGWKVHAQITGNSDRVAENEEECFAIIRDFLSYMPSHCDEPLRANPSPKGRQPHGPGPGPAPGKEEPGL